MVLRVLAAVCAAALGAGGFALVALGSCHESGGFCAESFGATHVVLYAIGVMVLAAATALATLAVTRRRDVVVGIASGVGVLLGLVIVLAETTG
jgi:hypothetical protein